MPDVIQPNIISFDEFKKLDLRVARVTLAERVDGSDKLLRLEVELEPAPGSELTPKRQIVAGIGKVYDPNFLIGREIIIVANLEPRKFTLRSDSGQVVLDSQGMLLAASDDGGPSLLTPDRTVVPGSRIS